MAIGAIWGDIWDAAIWNTAIWSQEAATPEPEVREITLHRGINIAIGIERPEIAAHETSRIVTDA